MNEKIRKIAEQYPEMYREKVAMYLSLRHQTNEIKRARGRSIRLSLEEKAQREFSHLHEATTKWDIDAQNRALDRKIEAAERVLENYRSGRD